ncbi:MAG: transaldolase family protein, partial [Clostridiales bacterium]|nr:transaldolase family protein [Clostridiales bacterium]
MLKTNLSSLSIPPAKGDEAYLARVWETELDADDYFRLRGVAKFAGVTERFRDVMSEFPTAEGAGTPAGFRRSYMLDADGVLRVDLARDISRDKNGAPRPTRALFSADSADPYEVSAIAPLIANLTCNPGIVYDLFINNPKANVGNRFKTRDEVMAEIAKVLGPGCDISVELNNPFEKDFGRILEEASKFREMLGKYRVVIKVPHTGPVTPDNVGQLLEGDRLLDVSYSDVKTAEAFRGHMLALKLHEHGFRINFTLMFEPYQTLLALQSRPYFINTFVRHRLVQSERIKAHLDAYDATEDEACLEALRDYMTKSDYLPRGGGGAGLKEIQRRGREIIKYRHFEDGQGEDGLDSMRHNLRALRACNLP